MAKKSAVAFGIFDYGMLPKINRILKPFGVKLKQRTSVNWGDQVELTVDPTVQEERFRTVAEKIMTGWYQDSRTNPPQSHREHDLDLLVKLMKQELQGVKA